MVRLKVAPSTDPYDSVDEILRFVKKVDKVADMIHVDCMDGVFVQRKTFDYKLVQQISDISLALLDVHLMEKRSDIDAYLDAGANIITLHYETYENKKALIANLNAIRCNRALAGLSIKPKTPVSVLREYLPYVDMILIMSVEPGISGQIFMPETYERVKELKAMLLSTGYHRAIKIEVDGGINPEIALKLKACGADVIVSGSYVASAKNKNNAIKELRCSVSKYGDSC